MKGSLHSIRDQVSDPGSLSGQASDDKPGLQSDTDKFTPKTVTSNTAITIATPKTMNKMTDSELAEQLIGTHYSTALAALQVLEERKPKDPKIHLKIATCLDTGYGTVADNAANLLRQLKPTDSRVIEQLEGYTKREGDEYLQDRAQKLLEDLRK